MQLLTPSLDLALWNVSGWPVCVSWSERGAQTHQVEEARVGKRGWVLHGRGGRRVADLGPVLKATVRHNGGHGRVGVGVGPEEMLRVGLHVVAVCRGLQERLTSGSGL